jgi:hypothetical protein
MSAAELRPLLSRAAAMSPVVFAARYGLTVDAAERCLADVRKIAGEVV